MKRLIILCSALLFAHIAFAQGFPNAMKQPKMKESRKQNRHYKSQGKRHHHKLNTQGDAPKRRK